MHISVDQTYDVGGAFVQELAKQIDDYTATYGPDDQLEWSLVLGEIRAFIEVSQHFPTL